VDDHFRSKTDILRALLEEPVAAYSRLAGSSAAVGLLGAGELLGAVIDTTADLHALVDVIGNDPSARSALKDLLPRSREVNEEITAALAGPQPDPRQHHPRARRLRGRQERHPGTADGAWRPPHPAGPRRAPRRR
jgi:AcrR family transcriptional regulator